MGQQSYIRFHLNLYRFSTISPVLLLILVSQVKCIPPSQPNSQDLKTLFSSIKPPNSTESITLSMSTTTTTPPLLNREDNDDIGTGRPWRIEHVCRLPTYGQDTEPRSFKIGQDINKLLELRNCTVIEGNLDILWMIRNPRPENYTNVVLPNLLEITGSLLFFRVNGLEDIGRILPNLRVIRARDGDLYGYGMALYEMENIQSISLSKLGYLGKGLVAHFNPQLCYVNTVNWDRIIPGQQTGRPVETFGNQAADTCRLLEGCTTACGHSSDNCWNMDTCQATCNCFEGIKGTDSYYFKGCTSKGECCHKQCLAGCAAPNSPTDCYVCKNVFYNGTCFDKCPRTNDLGQELFEYASRRCITGEECLAAHKYHKLHNNKCILECPPGWVGHDGIGYSENRYNTSVHICVKCDGICDKACGGTTFETVESTNKLAGCTIIEGLLEIAIGRRGDMAILQKNMELIHTVTKYVKIVRTPFITNLDFLKSLTRINGERLDRDQYAFTLMSDENLHAVWDFNLHPKLILEKGKMFIHQNPQLCKVDIERLLDHTEFLGTFTNDSGVFDITKESHTSMDISDVTNGNCYTNTLSLNIILEPILASFVLFNFSAFVTNDPRIIISYMIYYREVEENETASYYNSREMCDDEEALWSVIEVPVTDYDQNVYQESLLSGIESYTRYAAYVQTYTTKSISLYGGRSPIVYFHTYPHNPDPPAIVSITPFDGYSNIGLLVTWTPPEEPRGIISRYHVYYKELPWNTELIDRRNFCTDKVKEQATTVKPSTQPPQEVTDANDKAVCSCDENKEAEDGENIDKDDQAIFRYNFQNFLQNKVIVKRFPGRRKRGVDSYTVEEPYLTTVTTMTMMTTTESLNATTSVPLRTTTTPKKKPKPAPVDKEEASSTVIVEHNVTSIPIMDLKPYMKYTIEVVACHSYDNVTNLTRCSKRSVGEGTTSINPSLDVINSTTFTIAKIKNGSETSALNFSWDPPKKTNGPILTYTIKYYKADSDFSSTDTTQQICVQPSVFAGRNNSYIWNITSLLSSGTSYEFMVRVTTAGQSNTNWTEPKLVKLESVLSAGGNQTSVIVGTVFATIAILALFIALIGCWIYKKKKPPVPPAPLVNSINPDYLDTDNVYLPDEWELERTFVKIGEALGQGSFGMVYEGVASQLYNSDKKPRKVAIKTVNNSASIQERINFLNEASRMKLFECHHIVKLLGVVSQGSPVLVIMELMPLGDLRNYLRKHRPDEPDNDGRKPPTLREILQMAAEIADGMAYLADKKFVHRDLAARNCMVTADMTIKIGDFGMGRDVYYSEYYRKGGKGMLPVRWMAPESLRDGICTSKSDVWSYGIVLYEMATLAAQPYVGFTNEQVIPYVLEGSVMEMPSGCPKRLADLMTRCWQYFPKTRPTFTQILDMLQGDVKKTFFSVSWYYTQKDSDNNSQESESEDDDDADTESQPLNPASNTNSFHNLHADQDLDSPEDIRLEDMHEKALIAGNDMPGLFPYRGPGSSISNGGYNTATSLHNGHSSNASCNGDEGQTPESAEPTPPHRNITESLPISFLSGKSPPSYKNTLDNSQSESNNWSVDSSKGSNSCNGSANGHIPYSNMTAC